MGALNKLLTDQVRKQLGEPDMLPENVSNLLKEISETYDTFEADRQRQAAKKNELKVKLLKKTVNLKKAKAELKHIFNIANEGFYSRDLINDQYNYLSEGCQKIYGYSIDDFKRNVTLWREVILPEDLKIIEHDDEKLKRGESIISEYRIIAKDKSIRWIEVTVIPAFADGKLFQANGTIRNITERKLAEQQLEEQNMELIKTNSELDRFVYSASHELRSPLTSILGLVTLAKLQTSDLEKDKLLSLIEGCVFSLDGLIKDIIEYSRNTRVEIEHDEIKFLALVDEIKKPLNYLIETEKLSVYFDIWQESEFYSDRKRIAVVLNNLISNGVKYYDPGKAEPFIRIHIKTDNNQAEIKITDNGLGIPQENIENIFQMFYRANSEKPGSGLGLYIVKEILDRIGGTIRVESELGIGTSFFINIPNTKPA